MITFFAVAVIVTLELPAKVVDGWRARDAALAEALLRRLCPVDFERLIGALDAET